MRYLVEHCGLNAARLCPIGRGKAMPYLPNNPFASVNRRVRIRPADG
ncbi:hypothetical protein [Thiospirillum jenense]|uniref:OmpA-like domain-containing protein n=1 Tax=Thiospirillum jenense TaxID=1653858 RepID=A0A839HH21_9GAMM|nr:hypothetical protein [Thiospirillum jenense]MBB1126337.1 hypothetical protein [Thiospirillum jenense]